MTAQEQKSINNISLKQATLEANQSYMANDIQELKTDVKSLVEGQQQIMETLITMKSDTKEQYVSKKFVKWLIGFAVSAAALWFIVLDHIHKAIK